MKSVYKFSQRKGLKMNRTLKKIAAAALASALAIGTIVPPQTAQAATNKAAFAPVSFNGKGDDQSGDDVNTYYFIKLNDSNWAANYKISFDMYIPASLVKKASNSDKPLLVGSWVTQGDPNNDDNYASMKFPFINITYENGQPKLAALRDGDELDLSSTTSIKKYGDYYELSVKDLPSATKYYDDNGNEKDVDTSVSGYKSISLILADFNVKATSIVALDNVSLKQDDKEIFSDDYEKGSDSTFFSCPGNDGTVKPSAISKSIISVKSAVSIQKGKKASLKATVPSAAGKVSYKTSNKKVATVTSKGVVKGMKKGKATITVSAAGVSKKVKVTVK